MGQRLIYSTDLTIILAETFFLLLKMPVTEVSLHEEMILSLHFISLSIYSVIARYLGSRLLIHKTLAYKEDL